MRDGTKIDIASAYEKGQKYDEAVKAYFKNKEALAPILRQVVPEYQGCSIDEVIGYIEADSITTEDPVPDVPVITGDNVELSSVTEKLLRFDFRFRAVNPRLSGGGIIVKLHIDLEIQNSYRPGDPAYPIIKRAVYYACRELGSQLGTVTGETDYNRLEKTYSIWICNNGKKDIPRDLCNTITRYHIMKEDVLGKTGEPERDYDLMEVVIIRRDGQESDNETLDYLNGVFTSNIGKIEKYVDTGDNPAIKKEVDTMGGLWVEMANEKLDEGLAKGRVEGRAEGRAEEKQSNIERFAQYFLENGQAATKEEAIELATRIAK